MSQKTPQHTPDFDKPGSMLQWLDKRLPLVETWNEHVG